MFSSASSLLKMSRVRFPVSLNGSDRVSDRNSIGSMFAVALLSVDNMVIAPADTGNDESDRDAVIDTDHTERGK